VYPADAKSTFPLTEVSILCNLIQHKDSFSILPFHGECICRSMLSLVNHATAEVICLVSRKEKLESQRCSEKLSLIVVFALQGVSPFRVKPKSEDGTESGLSD